MSPLIIINSIKNSVFFAYVEEENKVYLLVFTHIYNTTKNNNTNSLAQLSSAEKLKQ